MSLRFDELPPQWKMVNNILNVYDSASDADVEEGMNWYNNAYEACDFMAQSFEFAPGQIAGVMAVVSPGMTWDENESAPARICDLYRNGVHWTNWTGFSTYPLNLMKSKRILDGDYSAIKGPKVVSFYGCIMGATDVVTVDRWSLRVAMNQFLSTDKIVPSGKKCYNAVSDAYKAAAELANINPCDMQAVTWTVYRNRYNGKGVRINREVMA
jgi:hypothetical protein